MDNISNKLNKNCTSQSPVYTNYVSCIKIDGVPILPPLLNEKDREEMRRYKKLAIEVQKKLNQLRRECFTDSSITDTDVVDDNFSTTSTGSFFTDMSFDDTTIKLDDSEKEMNKFNDKQNSDAEKETNMYVEKVETPLTNMPAIKNVPLSYESKNISVECNDVTVTEDASESLDSSKKEKKSPLRQLSHRVESFEKVFSDDVLKSLAYVDGDKNVETQCDKNISKVDSDKKNTESSDDNYVTANETLENIERDKTPSKLIRSDSFILENPSPLLIAQIQRENCLNAATKANSPPKRKTWNTVNTNSVLVAEENKITNIKAPHKEAGDTTKKLTPPKKNEPKKTPINSEASSKVNPRRKGWDFINAKEKWTSIENDIGKVKQKPTKRFNSLPSSASGSPSTKMFNSNSAEPVSLQMKISKLNEKPTNESVPKNVTPENDPVISKSPVSPLVRTNSSEFNEPSKSKASENVPYQYTSPERNSGVPKKPIIMSTPKKKTPESQKRTLKGFVTPIRKPRDFLMNIPSREYSPKRVRSAPRPIFTSQNKTDMLLRKPNFTLFKPQSPYYFVSERDKCGDSAEVTDIVVPEKENVTAHDDIQVLFNNNNCESEKSLDSFVDLKEKVDDSFTLSNFPSSAKSDIKELFCKMQEMQKKQMAELMKRQKEEQELFLKKFAEQQTLLLTKITEVYSSPDSEKSFTRKEKVNGNSNLLRKSESLIAEYKELSPNNNFQTCDTTIATSSFQSSQALYTLNSSNDTLADPNLTLRTDSVADQSMDEITIKYVASPNFNKDYHVVTSAEFRRSLSDDSLEAAAHLTNAFYNGNKIVAQIEKNITVCVDQANNITRNVKRNSSCSRVLFPTSEQVRAANIICAAAKGYLVRRLLKSERVQNLIQTIKDALLCAMELHHETVENIQPSDIELHRRLIQQVTAACVAFHDMFFKLSIKEQMAVIAHDRERQKEKLLRPVSARSSGSLSTTTQRVLERKLRRDSSVDLSTSSNRSSFSRSCHSAECRTRTRSLGTSDTRYKKTSPSSQDTSVRRMTGHGANKKPWR